MATSPVAPQRLLDEGARLLASIKSNLAACLQAGNFHAGMVYWTKQLGHYLDLKYHVSKADRVLLASLYYELALLNGMDLMLVQLWADTCSRLIKKAQELQQSDLMFEWKPLYELIDRVAFPRQRDNALPSDLKHITAIPHLLDYATRYFSANATQEILALFLPKIYNHSLTLTVIAQGYLTLFLPSQPRIQSTTTPPQFQYLPTLFSIWHQVVNCPTFDTHMLDLLSRIAVDQIGSVQWTTTQLNHIYTVGLRLFDLPVGSHDSTSLSNSNSTPIKIDMQQTTSILFAKRRHSERFRILARWIVYTIYSVPHLSDTSSSNNDNNMDTASSSSTLSLLANLIQAIESFFHPSNSGPWTISLCAFVKYLAEEFYERLCHEQEQDNPTHNDHCHLTHTPNSFRLTSTLNHKFVKILRTVVFLAMFGKNVISVSIAHSAIKFLALIEPSLIVPHVIARAYPALENLTETHRTLSSISVLTALSYPLANRCIYQFGARHITTLLHLTIPGIDMNDANKSFATLMFISSIIGAIPIYNLTGTTSVLYKKSEINNTSSDTTVPGWMGRAEWEADHSDHPTTDLDLDDQTPANSIASMQEEDEIIRATTADFEDWVVKFIKRVFTMSESLSGQDLKVSRDAESGLSSTLVYVCWTLFQQMSPELYNVAFKQVINWISSTVVPNALKVAGLFAAAVVSADPQKAFPSMFTLCHDHITDELTHGAASKPTLTPQSAITSDANLYWYQVILMNICRSGGIELVRIQDRLIHLLDTMFEHCQERRSFKYASKTLKIVLMSLTTVYPMDYRSANPKEWSDPLFISDSRQQWGKWLTPEQVNIAWHFPSTEEKQLGWLLTQRYQAKFTRSLQDLLGLSSVTTITTSSKTNFETRHLLLKNLTILRSILMGISSWAIDNSNSSGVVATEDVICTEQSHFLLDVNSCFVNDPVIMPQVKDLRRNIGTSCNEVIRWLEVQQSDDIEVLNLCIKIARTFLADRGIERSQYTSMRREYSYLKMMYKIKMDKKALPRAMQTRKAHLQNLLRMRYNSICTPTETIHVQLIDRLFNLSFNHFAAIRRNAQAALNIALRCHIGQKYRLLPKTFEHLEATTTGAHSSEEHRLKGALHLLSLRIFSTLCTRIPNNLARVTVILCTPPVNDKPSIQNALHKLYVTLLVSMPKLRFNVEISGPLKSIQLSDNIDLATIESIMSKVALKDQENKIAYADTLNHLTSLLSAPNPHWRYTSMAATMLSVLFSDETMITSETATALAQLCVSEHPLLRQIALGAIVRLLFALKHRSSNYSPNRVYVSSESFPPNWPFDQPTQSTEIPWFVDKTYQGWFMFPHTVVAYKPGPVNVQSHVNDQPAFEQLGKWFQTPDNVDALTKYLAQETAAGSNHTERFNWSVAIFFKSIFQTFGASLLAVWVPHIEHLLSASEDMSAQRAAVEMLSGVLRATKHWSMQDTERIWTWATPLIDNALRAITPETLNFWGMLIKFVCANRDPRRFEPLLKLILNFEIQRESSFAEARKIYLARTAIATCGWRILPAVPALLKTALSAVEHPYKLVRENLGRLINECVQLTDPTRWRSLQECILAHGVRNKDPMQFSGAANAQMATNLTIAKLHQFRVSHRPAAEGASEYSNVCRTVVSWLLNAFTSHRCQGTYPIVIQFLPELFAMQELDDPELVMLSAHTIRAIAQFSYLQEMVAPVMKTFVTLLSGSENGQTWHARVKTLPAIQIFYFRHLFLLSSATIRVVTERIFSTLSDPQAEIRHLGAATLSGLVRCSRRDAIEALKSHALVLLSTHLPGHLREQRSVTSSAAYIAALQQRHAGVLALSSLIAAFPYEVPKWMPDILVRLAEHTADPAIIQTTIRKTFADFKRTHQDTWHEDAQRFTEDQLSLLMDVLVSPSYYA